MLQTSYSVSWGIKLSTRLRLLMAFLSVLVVLGSTIYLYNSSSKAVYRTLVRSSWRSGSSARQNSSSRDSTDSLDVFRPYLIRKPMALSIMYWEQFGNALKNLFDLQCWARSVNICCVLEPSISETSGDRVFHFRNQRQRSIALQDVINMESWNRLSTRSNYSIVVSMEEFLKQASRKAIYVQIQYSKGRAHCKSLTELSSATWFQTLHRNGFIIETVCIKTKVLPFSNEIFTNKIFHNHSRDRNVTIIFDEWRGIKSTNALRLNLSDSRCQHYLKELVVPEMSTVRPLKIGYPKMENSGYSLSPLVPSKKVLAVVDTFLAKYVGQRQFIAIAVRTEKLRTVSMLEKNLNCKKEIFFDYQDAINHTNITAALLFSDFGVHGSKSHINPGLGASELVSFLEKWIKPELLSKDLDKTIEDVAGTKNSVFIAMTVSSLVARADCVVLVGGGAFQSQILNMYAHSHRGKECYYYRDSWCQQTYINYFN